MLCTVHSIHYNAKPARAFAKIYLKLKQICMRVGRRLSEKKKYIVALEEVCIGLGRCQFVLYTRKPRYNKRLGTLEITVVISGLKRQ